MDLTDQQLAVVLQACIDFAKQLLEQEGGFLPFGARTKPDGEVEFVQLAREDGGESLEDLYRRTGSLLADEALRNEIVAGALVANIGLPDQQEDDFQSAIAVLIEAPNFCRSIVTPYRAAGASDGRGESVDLGRMIPQDAERIVFAG